MDSMIKSINEHISVFLYPEGTRNKTHDPLINFHDGAFRLAIKTQQPIAVLTITDSDKVLPPLGLPLVYPGIIHGEWSPPVETTGMTDDDVPALKEKVRAIMIKILEKNASH
jgi:1-acyl-sn-glycerol-3-phosphate acyltransferase